MSVILIINSPILLDSQTK